MLSRVAETIYWLARYLERAENTARIVTVNANLLLDLPRGIAPGWRPLIHITGAEELFRELYSDYDERSVMRFLIGDTKNPGSMLSSLAMARENARTIRDTMPREAWEELNELHLFAKDNLHSGLSKRGRYAYLKRVFRTTQALTGILAGAMNHDAGYEFLRIGRMLERADMTSRIVDVRSATLLPDEPTGLRPFENIQWMSVLKSLTAYQMYRRKMAVRVRRADALRFLIQDEDFPRACYHCLNTAETAVTRLPRNDGPLRAIGRLERTLQGAEIQKLAFDNQLLHEFMDQLQVGLGQIHEEMARTYFLVETAPEGQTQTQSAA